jgi:hypothetical protein
VHLTGRAALIIFVSAVKTFTTIRESVCKRRHIYALAVALLALGLAVQAVHAKNSDYFPKTSQAVRFSTTVKIADLAYHVVVGPDVLLEFPAVLPLLTRPQIARDWRDSESPAPRPSERISFRPLRSPPVNL